MSGSAHQHGKNFGLNIKLEPPARFALALILITIQVRRSLRIGGVEPPPRIALGLFPLTGRVPRYLGIGGIDILRMPNWSHALVSHQANRPYERQPVP